MNSTVPIRPPRLLDKQNVARFGQIDRRTQEGSSRLHALVYACHHRLVNGYRKVTPIPYSGDQASHSILHSGIWSGPILRILSPGLPGVPPQIILSLAILNLLFWNCMSYSLADL